VTAGVVVYRLDDRLFFANASYVKPFQVRPSCQVARFGRRTSRSSLIRRRYTSKSVSGLALELQVEDKDADRRPAMSRPGRSA
jgi:hypothetical protein